jgi:hypothetical protein
MPLTPVVQEGMTVWHGIRSVTDQQRQHAHAIGTSWHRLVEMIAGGATRRWRLHS